MSQVLIGADQFKKLILERTPMIDVRAPVEFADGSFPGSVNFPIMNNDERAQVGTTFKKQGREAAIELGESLVSGDVKVQRVKQWSDFISTHPETVITCFRGGLRSKITQEWLGQAHLPRPRIEGGYKALRNFLMAETQRFSESAQLLIVSGATGAGKTDLLRKASLKVSVLDLEKLANHRGSAFGGFATPQPTQTNFENQLAADLLYLEEKAQQGIPEKNKGPFVVEDESRLIGSRAIPATFFASMRKSPIVLIEEPLEVRVENTFTEYVVNAEGDKSLVIQNFKSSIGRISRKLGGARAQEILQDIALAEQEQEKKGSLLGHKLWMRKILEWYYDPMYFGSLQERSPQILFKGTGQEVFQFLLSAKV